MPKREDKDDQPESLRYRKRRPGESEEAYQARLAEAHRAISALMARTRRPWEYD